MKTKFFLLAILLSFRIFANEGIVIPSDMCGVDQKNKLILVNQRVDEINATWSSEQDEVIIEDVSYKMKNSVESIAIGTAYPVEANGTTYSLYFTELPIIKISLADPGRINGDTKIPATFSIIDQSKTKVSSDIAIRLRGGVSREYPKKQYRINFCTDNTTSTNKDVSLLGMRSDDDWNLIAMYNEPLRIRNKTTFDIWRTINRLHYQSSEPKAMNSARLQYVEIFMNDQYNGVYCVGEPVDRKQLQLKKYDATTGIRGELYKGVDWGKAVMFERAESYTQGYLGWGGFEYKYPNEISSDWRNIYGFVSFVVTSSDRKFYAEYKSRFDFDNLVDYFIFLNLTRATDNTGKNIFIAKYKEGAPYFYVPWDLDGVFGIIWTGNRENVTNGLLTNGLYSRLLKDYQGNDFKKKVKQRWNQLVKDGLTPDNIIARFKENHDYLFQNGVYRREPIAWSAFYYSSSDFTYLSTWLNKRHDYLDQLFNSYESYSESTAKIYINEISGNEKWLEIYNAENNEIDLSGYTIQKIDEDGIAANWKIPSGKKITAGGFLYWTQDANCTNGSTFTWGISAKKDVAFKVFDNNGTELDYFEVRANLYSEGGEKTVGREVDGNNTLVIFERGTPGASNNGFSSVSLIPESELYKIQNQIITILKDVSFIAITDYSGKVLLRQKVSEDQSIDLSDLPFGIYILQLQLNDRMKIVKFIR